MNTSSADASPLDRRGSGTRSTARPSLAVALVRAWRTWHEQDPLLVTGPVDADRTADDDRARAELRAARPAHETPHPGALWIHNAM